MGLQLEDKRYVKIDSFTGESLTYSIYTNKSTRDKEKTAQIDYDILLQSIEAAIAAIKSLLPKPRKMKEDNPLLLEISKLFLFQRHMQTYIAGNDITVEIPLFEGRPFPKQKIERILNNMRTEKITAIIGIQQLKEDEETVPIDLAGAYGIFKEKGFLGFDTEDC